MLQIRHVAGGGDRAIVAAEGQVDLATAPRLAEALAQADGIGETVLDLTAVDFLDSVGVGVLVEAAVAARQRGAGLSVRGATGWVARVLEITGVDEYLRVVPARSTGTADPDR